MFMHVFTGAVPLILSLLQVWSSFRKNNIKRHRWFGRLCLLSSRVSAGPAAYLATKMFDNGLFENFLVVVASILWFASGALAFYFIKVKKVRSSVSERSDELLTRYFLRVIRLR